MKRKELKKAVSKYARVTKFYRYGLISKYLKHLEKEEQALKDSLKYMKRIPRNLNKIEYASLSNTVR